MDGCDIVVGARGVLEVVGVLTIIAKALIGLLVLKAVDLFFFRGIMGR